MKNLMNLKGAKLLSKVEQKSINGGIISCDVGCPRDMPYCCNNSFCSKIPCNPL